MDMRLTPKFGCAGMLSRSEFLFPIGNRRCSLNRVCDLARIRTYLICLINAQTPPMSQTRFVKAPFTNFNPRSGSSSAKIFSALEVLILDNLAYIHELSFL